MTKNLIKINYLWLIVPLVLSYFANNGYGFFFKAAVPGSCILVLAFLFRKTLKASTDIWYLFGAFFFSMVGDWFLSFKGDSFIMFSAGIGFYFFAHAGYLLFALLNGRLPKLFTVVLLAAYLVFFFLKLSPAIDDTLLRIATFIYLIISCISVGAALGIKSDSVLKWSYFLGVTFVLTSDTIIALYEYIGYKQLNYLILPTYYAAHISITLGVLHKFNKTRTS
uniref:lysoplasmalogenase n=1 Tax=uncultured Draconibacterium sp. TaxID=1573823 RepID=UPI003217BF65